MVRDPKALEHHIENYVKKEGYPGVAICIRGPEGLLFDRGFGYRSIRRNTHVDTDTVFGIASLSKSFTALACCILHVEGKLSLDDPVNKYFPEFSIPGLPIEAVTLKLLGLHRAGLPPMEPLEWSISMNSKERDTDMHRYLVETAPNKMETIEQIIEYIAQCPYGALGSPGEYMSYSNEGYAILSYVVDRASGMTLEEFLDERIFRPLGMDRSILDVDCSQARALIGDDNITSLFSTDDQGALLEDDDWSVLPPYRGCAMVKSTASNLTKYYQMLSQRGVFQGRPIIPEQAIELLVGREYPLRREPYYCQGLRKYLIGNRTVCDHGGELHGVSAFGGFTDGGYSAVVLCNGSELDMEGLQWICYNYIFGLPLDMLHHWAIPSGGCFSRPDMVEGEYVAHEGKPSYCVVRREGDALSCTYQGEEKDIQFCHSTVFAVYDSASGVRESTFRFHMRGGRAWGINCGSRIFQRV